MTLYKILTFFSLLITTLPISEVPMKSILIEPLDKTNFIGLWMDNSTFMYSADLSITEDSIFSFHDRGCTARRFSKGKWKIKGDNLVLLSFDEYNLESKKHVPSYVSIKQKGNKNNHSRETTILIDTASFKFEKRDFSDSTAIFFNKVEFVLDGDTLFMLNEKGQKTSSKYTRH